MSSSTPLQGVDTAPSEEMVKLSLSVSGRSNDVVAVYIYVGNDRYTVFAPGPLLASYSSLFAEDLKKDAGDSKIRTVTLQGITPAAFSAFVDVIETQLNSDVFRDRDFAEPHEVSEEDYTYHLQKTFKHMIDLWLLAENLKAPKMQNFLIDGLILKSLEKGSELELMNAWKYAYELTPPGSPLRRLLTSLVAREEMKDFEERRQLCTQEMLGDLVVTLLGRDDWYDDAEHMVFSSEAPDYYVSVEKTE